jgi:hypothetical protein
MPHRVRLGKPVQEQHGPTAPLSAYEDGRLTYIDRRCLEPAEHSNLLVLSREGELSASAASVRVIGVFVASVDDQLLRYFERVVIADYSTCDHRRR